MVNIVIIMWQGVIEDVRAYQEEGDAFVYFELETQTSWKQYQRLRETEDCETILGDYAGSTIYEVRLR